MRSILLAQLNFVPLSLLVIGLGTHQSLLAQGTISTDPSDGVSRPYPCWTGEMEFYSQGPYFEHEGYLFEANPFVVVQYREGNTAMIMVSSKGWRLIDAGGRKIWTDPRIYVQCRVVSYPWGYNQRYAVVIREMGMMEDCARGPNTNPMDPGFDPYYETGDEGSCSVGSGSGGSGPPPPSGTICNTEWMAIDISYDGGVTWTTVWEGLVKVCR